MRLMAEASAYLKKLDRAGKFGTGATFGEALISAIAIRLYYTAKADGNEFPESRYLIGVSSTWI
jgi:hypothetical protein